MKKILISTSMMLILSIFTLSLKAQTATQTAPKEKAKTEQTVDNKTTGCQSHTDGNHKCTGKENGKCSGKCASTCSDKSKGTKSKNAKAGCCSSSTKSNAKGCCSSTTTTTTTSETNTTTAKPAQGCANSQAKPGCCSHKK